LVDRVQILGIQEQKNNIIEAQRKTQYDARMQSAKTALAGLSTPPPNAGAPVFFQLQLPSPPSSPDEERNELTNYLQQLATGISVL
jgi:hypothetical protein